VTALQVTALVLAGLVGPTVALTRQPVRQAAALSVYGLVLAVLFFTVSAPDVALSQLTVGMVALPAMILLALAKLRHQERHGEEGEK
jgi:energy-converting hydrogenase B subunit D